MERMCACRGKWRQINQPVEHTRALQCLANHLIIIIIIFIQLQLGWNPVAEVYNTYIANV